MANVIKIKRGTSTPTTSDIVDGEVAVDKSAQKLYLNDGGSIKEIGGGSGGTATQITVADESSDTTCFPVFTTAATGDQAPKTGTNFTFNSSTGTVKLTSSGSAITINNTITDIVDIGQDSGAFSINAGGTANKMIVKAAGTERLEINTSGVEVTGVATATSFSGSGSSLTGLTGASAATYGDGSNVAQIAVDANGRITGISNVSISGGGGSGTPLRYLHVDGTGTQNLSTTAITLDFDTTIATSDAGDFTVGTGGEITVINAGNYYVEYSATGDQTAGSNRIIISAQLEVNGTVVTGSQADVYSRNTNDGDFSAVGSSFVVLSANDVIRVRAFSDSNTLTATIDNSISGLSMFSLSGSGPQGPQGVQGPSDVPQNSQTSAYTLVSSDNGKHVNITTGGVTVPSGVFSAGNVVSIYNDSASSQTITQGASVTLREGGTANTGNVVLSQRGLCTILCIALNEFVITGHIA